MSFDVKGNNIDDKVDEQPSGEPSTDGTQIEGVEPRAADVDAKTSDGPNEVRSRRLTSIVVMAAVAASAVLLAGAGYQYWGVFTANQHVTQTQEEVGQIAADGAVAILSYRFDTVDQDLEKAQGLITGEFADYYKTFTADVVAPAAKEKSVITEATIAGTAVEQAESDRAVVLVFVNQSTVTAENASPTLTASSVRVELTKVDGQWRIAKFDPV